MLYRVLLFSVKPQHESAIGIHISPPFWNSLPSVSPSHPGRLFTSWAKREAQEYWTYSFSIGSSWPRNLTGVSCIAGRFFINWAITGKAQEDMTPGNQRKSSCKKSVRVMDSEGRKERKGLSAVCKPYFLLKKILTSLLTPHSSLHSNHRFPFPYFELLSLPHTLEIKKWEKVERKKKRGK